MSNAKMTRTLAAAGLLALLALPASAAGDCCMGGPDLPIGYFSRFPSPTHLRTTLHGHVRSDKPAHYTAYARINVGPRTVASVKVEGRSTTRWSALRLTFSPAQQRKVREAAHRIHRAPVLYVRLKGTFPGEQAPHYGFAHYNVSLR
jgi:hypothetical protein